MNVHNWLPGALLVLATTGAYAQVPVDANGLPFGDADSVETGGAEPLPFTDAEVDALVAPIALYPDDLLAIVLPASTYPLQLVEAGRFLEALEQNPSLEPDADWDDSVVALINYPEIIELLNADLDWTWQLGEAVITQQADVLHAVEAFRDRAYAAGNLHSDEHQRVSRDEGLIEILPVSADIIHVPYYEPEAVVIPQSYRVYHYYPEPRPVYYYPYADSHAFSRGYFWGVTTAFTIGWTSNRLRVHHHSYQGHPYYGRRYYDRWWYRRPSIDVHRTTYIDRRVGNVNRRYNQGDYWRSSRQLRLRRSDQRITRNRTSTDRRIAATQVTVQRSGNVLRSQRNYAPVRQSGAGADRRTTRDQRERTQREVDRQTLRTREADRTGETRVRRAERTAERVAPQRADRTRDDRRAARMARESAAERTQTARSERRVRKDERTQRPQSANDRRQQVRAERAPRSDRRDQQRSQSGRKKENRQLRQPR